MNRVAILLVTYEKPKRSACLLRQLCQVELHGWETHLLALDNSTTKTLCNQWAASIEQARACSPFAEIVLEQPHQNLRLARVTNHAVTLAAERGCEYLVYLCSNHCYLYRPHWLQTMLDDFAAARQRDPKIVLGGTVEPVPASVIVNRDAPMTHVQGGLFIGAVSWMQAHAYNVQRWPHAFMDVDLSQRVLLEGYKLHSIPSLYSVMSGWDQGRHRENLRTGAKLAVHSGELAAILDQLPEPQWG